MTSRREELGDTGRVEPSLSQTESGTQTGTTGTNNNSIVLVILGIPVRTCSTTLSPPHTMLSLFLSHFPDPVSPQGPSFAYNNRIFLRNGSLGLFSAQWLVGKYPGWKRQRNQVSTVILRLGEGHSMGTYQPDGRKKTDVSDSAEHERTITQFTSAQFTMHRNAIMRLLKDQCITPGGSGWWWWWSTNLRCGS